MVPNFLVENCRAGYIFVLIVMFFLH